MYPIRLVKVDNKRQSLSTSYSPDFSPDSLTRFYLFYFNRFLSECKMDIDKKVDKSHEITPKSTCFEVHICY